MPLVDNSIGDWAHMDPLQFVTETGVGSAVLFYLLVAAFVVRSVRNRNPVSAAFACALMTAVLQAHTNFTFYVLPILIICGVWMAGWHVSCGDNKDVTISLPDPWQRRIVGGAAIILALFFTLLTASSAAGLYYDAKAKDALAHTDIKAFIANIETAQKFAPASFINPQVRIAALNASVMKTADVFGQQKETYEQSLNLLSAAEKLNPAWSDIDFQRGNIFDAVSEKIEPEHKERAITAWQKAIRKNPLHVKARMALARALIARGQPGPAYDILQAGLSFPHDKLEDDKMAELLMDIAGLARLQNDWRLNDETKNKNKQ